MSRNRVCRLATRMLPPHRKEWAEAMLNESAYIRSRGAALQWALGCTLAAFRERLVYEFGRAFMARKIVRALLGGAAVLLIAGAGIYITAKPYQRERIWITVQGMNRAQVPND